MRSLIARLALTGVVGAALAGCGTGTTSLPSGAFPNNSGGGPTNVAQQAPPTNSVADLLIDGGIVSATNTYSGYNVAATDAQSTADAGADAATRGSQTPPADPIGSHLVTFSGSGTPRVSLQYRGTLPNLTYTSQIPGDIMPVDYGAIVLHATRVTPGTTSPGTLANVAIELAGGANNTRYDVRIVCATAAAPTGAAFARYVCALPAYGAASGLYTTSATTTTNATTKTTTTTFGAAASGGAAIEDPITPGATGSFTPTASRLNVVLLFGNNPTPTASTGNTIGLDYVYAEGGGQ